MNFYYYLRNFLFLQRQGMKLSLTDIQFHLSDRSLKTPFDTHYIYHTAWAARTLKKINPTVHIDVSSLLYFSTILSAFIPVEFYDYRPVDIFLSNLKSDANNLFNLNFESNTIESISCMHTIEHIGLGRYGDLVDLNGDQKAISELKRVVQTGGNLIIVVPMGKPRIVYNAHRVYSFNNFIKLFPEFSLIEFAFIPDDGKKTGILINPEINEVQNSNYGCGCLWLRKN